MKKNIFMAFIGLVILTAFDQLVKFLVDSKMMVSESKKVIDGVFNITYVQNKGAAWGSFSGKRVFLLLLTCVILFFLIFMYIKLVKADKMKCMRVFMVFLSAGAIGNIIDRFIRGFVVDMFDFCLINFPVFNVADIYVTCSVIILFILVVFVYSDEDLEIIFGRKK